MTTLDLRALFAPYIPSGQPITHDLIRDLMLGNQALRKRIIDIAMMLDSEWEKITSIISVSNETFTLDNDSELVSLAASPGNIDYNISYRDGCTYKDPDKAKLQLETLRALNLPNKAYEFFFKHLLMKYHTYLGTVNDNFRMMAKNEIDEYRMGAQIPDSVLDQFIESFARKWQNHLNTVVGTSSAQYDLAILSSDGGTAHKVAGETLQKQLQARGRRVIVINETTELGKDPLESSIGFRRGLNFNQIKQQAGDEVLYKALNVLSNKFTRYVPDIRMNTLRQKTQGAHTVLSLNTFAHDSRLAADGHRVIFDVIDSIYINGKMIQLAMDDYYNGLDNIEIITHGDYALIRDKQGRLLKVEPETSGIHFAAYPVADAEKLDAAAFKKQSGLTGKHLSVLTFGGQGCSGKAETLLKILMKDNAQQRDIVLLAGSGYVNSLKEVSMIVGQAPTESKDIEFENEKFTASTFTLANGNRVHVWSKISQNVMCTLSQNCDHFIIKPGASTTQEVMRRQAKGVVIYYDGSHSWEKGNLKMLCEHGAAVVYDRTPKEFCEAVLKAQSGKPMTQTDESYPKVADVVDKFISSPRDLPKLIPLPPASIVNHEPLPIGDLMRRGIAGAVKRIMSAQQGALKKDSDRIPVLRKDVTQAILTQWFEGYVQRVAKISPEDILSIGTQAETENIKAIVQYMKEMEKAILFIGEDTPSLQGGSKKPIIIWTGFEAMDASIKDPNAICNFDVPLMSLYFILWEEIFCHQASIQNSEHLQTIPMECDPEKIASHPAVIMLKEMIYQLTPGMSPNEIARIFFGSELTDEAIKLAEVMGLMVSKIFVSRFMENAPGAIVYFSNNKIDEHGMATLPINTITWDTELPMLREKFGNAIIFRGVYNGQVIEKSLDDILLVRNRYQDDILQDRRAYTCGMPALPEWLFMSSVEPRKTLSVALLKQMVDHWRTYKQPQTATAATVITNPTPQSSHKLNACGSTRNSLTRR